MSIQNISSKLRSGQVWETRKGTHVLIDMDGGDNSIFPIACQDLEKGFIYTVNVRGQFDPSNGDHGGDLNKLVSRDKHPEYYL